MKSFVTGQISIEQPIPIVIAVTGSGGGITHGHLPGAARAVQIGPGSHVFAGDGGYASG
jgi:hypothetical protein